MKLKVITDTKNPENQNHVDVLADIHTKKNKLTDIEKNILKERLKIHELNQLNQKKELVDQVK